jgi:hypothetical protein
MVGRMMRNRKRIPEGMSVLDESREDRERAVKQALSSKSTRVTEVQRAWLERVAEETAHAG